MAVEGSDWKKGLALVAFALGVLLVVALVIGKWSALRKLSVGKDGVAIELNDAPSPQGPASSPGPPPLTVERVRLLPTVAGRTLGPSSDISCAFSNGVIGVTWTGGSRSQSWFSGCCADLERPVLLSKGALVSASYALLQSDSVEIFFEQGELGHPDKKGYLIRGPLDAATSAGERLLRGALHDEDGVTVELTAERACVLFRTATPTKRGPRKNEIRVSSIEATLPRALSAAASQERR